MDVTGYVRSLSTENMTGGFGFVGLDGNSNSKSNPSATNPSATAHDEKMHPSGQLHLLEERGMELKASIKDILLKRA